MSKVQISIDRGGTFCDVWANIPGKGEIIFKLLSEDPDNYNDAPAEGIRRVLEIFTDSTIERGTKLDGDLIEWVRMGTTVATNALLERKGEPFVLLTTKGFQDVLEIGTQSRPELFNLRIKPPEILYDKVIQVNERITVETSSDDPNQLPVDITSDDDLTLTASGTIIRVIEKLNVDQVEAQLKTVWDQGYRSIAVCLAHAYLYDEHELEIESVAKKIGFDYISLSSKVSKNINFIKRGNSTCIDAFLTPHVQRYIDTFVSSFSKVPRIEFMKSDGGLTEVKSFRGINAILSGPAGGVVGLADTCLETNVETPIPIIGFDMGGTSTDVSRVDISEKSGSITADFDISYDNKTAGLENSAPQLNIHTVAAGGGSILKWENGLFHVGPESAGAHPGPACYRKGGPLTVTDANLMLGRLDMNSFPHIFGPDGNEPLDLDKTKSLFERLTQTINKDTGKSLTPQEVALGFLIVANETMAKSIREITEARGYITKEHNLVSFGGAGSQNCLAVARSLDIKRVLVHRYSSVLSAYGIAVANVSYNIKEPFVKTYDENVLGQALEMVELLKVKVSENLITEQFVVSESIAFEVTFGIRYKSSNTILPVTLSNSTDYLQEFLRIHEREFGFNLPDGVPILIDFVEVRGFSIATNKKSVNISSQLNSSKVDDNIKPIKSQTIHFENGSFNSGVYQLDNLPVGVIIKGPALLTDKTQTILLDPHSSATITSDHVVIDVAKMDDNQFKEAQVINENTPLLEADPIILTVFGHRFMAIAETMGRVLQKTSTSSSIKERLDFSCAIFDSDGGLVANAPHIPVHLGSMQYAIKHQHNLWADKLKPGDVLLSNHPEAGGTHLPDLTVITPVFHQGNIVFYCASRGHHADIGGAGITAMAPNSTRLVEEGVAIKSFKLVSEGQFQQEAIVELFNQVGEVPGCSATKKIDDNLSDLKAQVSANQTGIKLVEQLFIHYGQPFVQFYMRAIRYNAELIVRNFFKKQYDLFNGKPIEAIDYFDDGTPVKLKITIDKQKGEGYFDFTGTGPETYGPMNTPPAITHSCVLYVIRCLIDLPIPLNQGCLAPCHITIPKNTILNPSDKAAICGSTISGQRVTDVILKAFDCCAASQGCANSFGWGAGGKDLLTGQVKPGFATGEALGGGVGALDGYNGASATNVHCTNTRTTDIEVVETRTPVLVTRWEIRRNSGGDGLFKGGDGAIREIEARIPLRVSILSERRTFEPYGIKGGKPGQRGLNLWYQKQANDEYIVTNIGGKAIINVEVGDRVQINTPGGGGYGVPIDI